MAITAWAAKFLTSSICLSVNGRYLLAVDDDRADQIILLEHWHRKMVRAPPSPLQHVSRLALDVGFGQRISGM